MTQCILNYTCNRNYLTDNEWKTMIRKCLSDIENTRCGNILLRQIDGYIQRGNVLNISNYNSNRSFQYPHINQRKINNIYKVNVCIPDTPYFIKIPVISQNFSSLVNDNPLLFDIYNQNPLRDKLDKNFVDSFCEYTFQPTAVVLFHELVHVLRLFKNISDDVFEEEATMYGIIDKTLIVDNIIITENTFRKELNLLPRISHDSKYLHVYDTLDYDTVKPKSYWKSVFTKLSLD